MTVKRGPAAPTVLIYGARFGGAGQMVCPVLTVIIKMENIKLPLTQKGHCIYEADGGIIGSFISQPLAEITSSALNALIPGIEYYRKLSDSISTIEKLLLKMDPSTRELLEPHIEAAHKAKKQLFTQSKLITSILKFNQS